MKHIVLMIALLTVAACGFRPVYGVNRDTPTGVESKLETVRIENIPDREGQYLRNALIDRFYRSGRPADPAYSLGFLPVTETLTDLDITKTSDATRGQLRLDTVMRLSDIRSGETLIERRLISVTSYNILGSEFATRVTEDNARTNALDDLARQAEMQVSLYFKRQ